VWNPCGNVWNPCGSMWNPWGNVWNGTIPPGIHLECGGRVNYWYMASQVKVSPLRATTLRNSTRGWVLCQVSGDFSIGAWGFVGEPMDLIVSQCVYVMRQAQVVQ